MNTATSKPEAATWSVLRPSQHGEEEKTFATGFASREEAEAWIEAYADSHVYLPYVEQAA
jgi:hypothetical protein